MAERKAKEIAIDVAFANYLIEERKKQEAKEREKEQMRREKGVILRNIFYRIHKYVLHETKQCFVFHHKYFPFSSAIWKRFAEDDRGN